MYYHVILETSEKIGKGSNNKEYFELDNQNLNDLLSRIIYPYLQKEDFQFDGYFIQNKEVRRIAIRTTDKSSKELSDYENKNMPSGIVMYISPSDVITYDEHSKDITKEVFDKAKKEALPKTIHKEQNKIDLSKIFIVHGRDNLSKTETARFIERLGLTPIILHEQANSGQTIIEKIEAHSNVGFGIILYTPCDTGGLAGGDQKSRARQNVVFEHGYLIGKLGRHKVCALVKDDVETPTDISGVVYIPLDKHGAWHLALAKELRTAGFTIDMNKVI